MQTTKGTELSVEYLPKSQARRLYSVAQEKEEQVLEERRMRDMEESRARAGGIVLQGGPSQSQTVADPMQKLQQLKGMLDARLITQKEFDTKKAEILSTM